MLKSPSATKEEGMSDLHGQIINIPTHDSDSESIMRKLNNWPSDEKMQYFVLLAYKIGHRDARHASAELAIPVQAQRDKLLETLKYTRELVRKLPPSQKYVYKSIVNKLDNAIAEVEGSQG